MSSLALTFEDNGSFHNDLVLRLDNFDRRCDTYYLVNDNALAPDQRDASKVRLVLARLLEQWQADIAGLGDGETTFLPYEFDDQASGWLRVTALPGDEVEVLPVWSSVEGWAFDPSDYAEAREQIGQTTPVWENLRPQRLSRREALGHVDASLAAASSKTDE